MTQAKPAGQETSEPNVIHVDPVAVMQELTLDRDFSMDRRKFLAGQVLILQQQVAEREGMILSRDERIKALEADLIKARANAGKGA